MKEESARGEGEKEAVYMYIVTCTLYKLYITLYNVHVAYMYTKVTGSEHTGTQSTQRTCNVSVFYNILQYASKKRFQYRSIQYRSVSIKANETER